MLTHFLHLLIDSTLVGGGFLYEGGDGGGCLLLAAEGRDAELHVLGHGGVLLLRVLREESEDRRRVPFEEGELLHHLF